MKVRDGLTVSGRITRVRDSVDIPPINLFQSTNQEFEANEHADDPHPLNCMSLFAVLEFSIAFCANTVQWANYSMLPAIASRDFAFPRGAEDVNLLTATYEIMNVVAAIPTIWLYDKYGLTTGLNWATFFNISGALLKIVTLVAADVTGQDNIGNNSAWISPFTGLLVAQMLLGVGSSLYGAPIALMSAAWFPYGKSRLFASTLMANSMNIGAAIGSELPSIFVLADGPLHSWSHSIAWIFRMKVPAHPVVIGQNESIVDRAETTMGWYGLFVFQLIIICFNAIIRFCIIKREPVSHRSNETKIDSNRSTYDLAFGEKNPEENTEKRKVQNSPPKRAVTYGTSITPLKQSHIISINSPTAPVDFSNTNLLATEMHQIAPAAHSVIEEDSRRRFLRFFYRSIMRDAMSSAMSYAHKFPPAFLMLLAAFSVSLGVSWSVAALLTQLLTPFGVSQHLVGAMSSASIVVGSIFALTLSSLAPAVDSDFGGISSPRSKLHRAIMCCIGANALLLAVLAIFLRFFLNDAHPPFGPLVFLYILFGIPQSCLLPFGFEYAAQLTRPMVESTSSCIMYTGANLGGLLSLLVLPTVSSLFTDGKVASRADTIRFLWLMMVITLLCVLVVSRIGRTLPINNKP